MPLEDPGPDASAIGDILAWLGGGDVGLKVEPVLARLGPDLVRAGVPVARVAIFVRTLHPELYGSRYAWTRDGGVSGADFPPSITSMPEYRASPTGHIREANRELLRWRLEGAEPLGIAALEQMRAAGMTDYVGHPLRFADGEVNTAIYCADSPGGFSDAALAALRQLTVPLARLVEIAALRRVASNLLDVYVGHNAGERILAGHVRRGATERIQCVIWFSDLRGFTTLSAERDPESTIGFLNRLFECQVAAVERRGGEVLKFIGDGMLAIFRVDDPARAPAVVREAVDAATEAFAALDAWNAERARVGEPPLQFGLALHLGEVAYGNIGSERRLDFTCIGAAVNLASRVEGLAGKLGKRLLLTAAAADVADIPLRSLGRHAVKGVAEAPEVFELAPRGLTPSAP